MPDIPIKDWPPYSPEDVNRRDGAIQAAKLMMNAALTAPVTGGIAQTEGHLVWGQREQEQIARKMEESHPFPSPLLRRARPASAASPPSRET